MVSVQTARCLELSMLKGVGPATLRKIACIDCFWDIPAKDLMEIHPSIRRALLSDAEAWDTARRKAEYQIKMASQLGSLIISNLDPCYPSLLRAAKDDPFLLFVKGQLRDATKKAVAVVGTRIPTSHGAIIAERVSRYIITKDVTVVSGLAMGCDAIAHQAAISTNGHTVAVLAHGLQTIAPASNRFLSERILDTGGALITEFPFGTEPKPAHFVQRDKTQAGISLGVVMVQSGLRGGSLHASRAAIRYGRWLAVPLPTKHDIALDHQNIQANMVLIQGEDAEKAAMLESLSTDLRRIIPLRGKEDYHMLGL